jgi:hypothetical protein
MSETTGAVPTRERALTVHLFRPVEYAGGTISELRLRPATSREMKETERVTQRGMAYMEKLVSLVAGVHLQAVELMDADQVVAAGEWVMSFFPNGPATGAS